MKCPKCRSEVGNQAVCPYCGGTVYIQDSTWDAQLKMLQQHTGVSQQMQVQNSAILNMLASVNMKLKLIMILQGALLAIIILVLMVLCIA